MSSPAPASSDQDLLETRARALARPIETEGPSSVAMAEISVAGEKYALPLDVILEVSDLVGSTPIPHAPTYWLGLVNLRGHLYPLLDLAALFQITRSRPPDGRLALVSDDRLTIAIVTDGSPTVSEIPSDAIEPPPIDLPDPPRSFITGLAPGFVSILDPHRLLNDSRLILDENIGQ